MRAQPFDVPVPAVYGMLGGSGSSSTSTAPIALQPQHLPPTGSQPPAVQPLHTMVRLQPAQQGAAITVSGFAKRNGPPLTQQQPWQQALLLKAPPAAFAEEDVLQFCSRFQRRPQRAAAPALPFLTAHQPIACQAPNGASTVAMPVEQNHSAQKAHYSCERQGLNSCCGKLFYKEALFNGMLAAMSSKPVARLVVT